MNDIKAGRNKSNTIVGSQLEAYLTIFYLFNQAVRQNTEMTLH